MSLNYQEKNKKRVVFVIIKLSKSLSLNLKKTSNFTFDIAQSLKIFFALYLKSKHLAQR